MSVGHRQTKRLLRAIAFAGLVAAGVAASVALGSSGTAPAASTSTGATTGATGTTTTGATTTTTVTTTIATTSPTISPPMNTSPPTITGTPVQGRTLTGDRGKFSGNPTDYNYFWVRCDKNGGSCSNISGAHATTYRLTSADVGNTIRFKVQATNADGSVFASSVPTAVVGAAKAPPPPPPPPPATGCPAGNGTAQVASVMPPARLVLDQQIANPTVVRRSTAQIIIRYHVADSCGQSVQGALVYATAVPFGQFSIPAEATTDASGFAELVFRTEAGFPVSSRQQLIALFVRARKPGENLLGGISTRRLFSLSVNQH